MMMWKQQPRAGVRPAVLAVSIVCSMGLAYGQTGGVVAQTQVSMPDPISSQLRQISSQLGQLRRMAIASDSTRRTDDEAIKNQLLLIDENIRNIGSALAAAHQEKQQRLDSLTAWLIVAIGLMLLMVSALFIQTIRRGKGAALRTTSETLTQSPEQTVESVMMETVVKAPSIVSTQTVLEGVQETPEFIRSESVPELVPTASFGMLVDEELKQTQQYFTGAKDGFMKPVHIKDFKAD